MIKITSHSLAQKLLSLPDLLVFIDGIGEEVGIACEPNLGSIIDTKTKDLVDIVVLEIVTKRQEDKDREHMQLMEEIFPAKK